MNCFQMQRFERCIYWQLATGVNQMRETVYKEFSSARWNFWTYCDGIRHFISQKSFDQMIKQGAKCVVVK